MSIPAWKNNVLTALSAPAQAPAVADDLEARVA